MSSGHTDFYLCEDLLSEDEKQIRDDVRNWVDRRYLPRAADYFETAEFPVELIPEMGAMGLFGIKLNEYGGRGKNNVSFGLVCQELERGDSALRSFVSVMNSLVIHPIYSFGSREQKQRWLPELVRGAKIGCFGLSEPEAGSDPRSMRATAVKTGGRYILNGRKMWITNGAIADVAVVWAKTENGRVRGFLVEKGTPGFSARPVERKFSMRASVTSVLNFDNVSVPEENLLPGTTGLKSALMCLNEGRFGIAWGSVGAAIACYEAAVNYAKSRIQFGAPIASFQLVQQKLTLMLTEITKAQLLCIRLGRLKDEGRASPQQIAMAKMNNAFEALKIARSAREILGANGITLGHPPIRHMLNLETLNTYEGTRDIHILSLGRHITGMSAFSCEPEEKGAG
ncbi:MAG: acyl-CoA dehydrogenase family protein [Syntrophobacteraceae bacterium]|nr:acyl-CoA dehydrogenase family protein [Syntrophobacteraceae bacterium]